MHLPSLVAHYAKYILEVSLPRGSFQNPAVFFQSMCQSQEAGCLMLVLLLDAIPDPVVSSYESATRTFVTTGFCSSW